MSRQRHNNLLEAHVVDVLSATWVFSCNDENPIITYKGISHRLNLSPSFDVKDLVRSRGDLFRSGVRHGRLEAWKQEMLADRHVPRWIREITDEPLRKRTIDALTEDDVFRSQFRAGSGAPPSPIEIINWGLEHIERLRKANYEQRDKSAKTYQQYLTTVAIFLPILTTFAALYSTQSHDLLIKNSERDASSKIEFLKFVTDHPEKKTESIRNWKAAFGDDKWLDDFAKATK